MLAPVRARDLRANIKEWGFEQGVIITLERMLDEHVQDRQNIRELVSLVDKCIDEVAKMGMIGDKIREELVVLRRQRDQGDVIDGTAERH
jgi:hypothetical protein